MLLLGHIGITLGAVGLLADVIKQVSSNTTDNKNGPASASSSDEKVTGIASGKEASWINSIASNKDAKYLIIGSILPDIIDKPVGLGICRNKFSNGRIFSHTLLFPAVLTALGAMLYRRSGKSFGISLSLGAFAHIILDKMWREPKTLFWPLFGYRFERVNTSNWLFNIIRSLFTDPVVYKPEVIGGMILLRLKGRR